MMLKMLHMRFSSLPFCTFIPATALSLGISSVSSISTVNSTGDSQNPNYVYNRFDKMIEKTEVRKIRFNDYSSVGGIPENRF